MPRVSIAAWGCPAIAANIPKLPELRVNGVARRMLWQMIASTVMNMQIPPSLSGSRGLTT
jgi:hypothetical protein